MRRSAPPSGLIPVANMSAANDTGWERLERGDAHAHARASANLIGRPNTNSQASRSPLRVVASSTVTRVVAVAVDDGLSPAARLLWLMIIVRVCAVRSTIPSMDARRAMIDT